MFFLLVKVEGFKIIFGLCGFFGLFIVVVMNYIWDFFFFENMWVLCFVLFFIFGD